MLAIAAFIFAAPISNATSHVTAKELDMTFEVCGWFCGPGCTRLEERDQQRPKPLWSSLHERWFTPGRLLPLA